MGDEISMASPPLLAGVSRRASHGRMHEYNLSMDSLLDQPFGNVLVQCLMADFMQLNPVRSHTLLEALLKRSSVPGVPRQVKEEDTDGFKLFREMCRNVVLFTGTHWFLDDSLPRLATIMRTPGGARVPDDLRALIQDRIVLGSEDPRLHPEFVHEGITGFFAYGARAGIQWEQVARLMQLHVIVSARSCAGPVAPLRIAGYLVKPCPG